MLILTLICCKGNCSILWHGCNSESTAIYEIIIFPIWAGYGLYIYDTLWPVDIHSAIKSFGAREATRLDPEVRIVGDKLPGADRG